MDEKMNTENTETSKFKAAIVDAVREVLAERDKKHDRPTKEEILAIRNPVERQRMIRENMDLFRNR